MHEVLELRAEARDHRLRVLADVLVGDQAELHGAVVREDRHAHADVARLRHPEHHLPHRRAGQIERLLRPGHVGHHRGGLARQQIDHLLLHRTRRHAGQPQQRHRQHRRVAGLQFVHPLAHGKHALDRMLDAYRQQHRHQAEFVAERLAGARGAQIHRHHRAQLGTGQVFAVIEQIAAQRAGRTRQQHVVDRAAERLADRLDVGQRQRLVPCHDLGATGPALEARRGVGLHQGQCGDVLRQLRGHPRVAAGRLGGQVGIVEQRAVGLQRLRCDFAGDIDRAHRGMGERTQPLLPPLGLLAHLAARHGLQVLGRRGRGHRQEGAHQRNTVANAVVNADDDRVAVDLAVAIVLDHMELPQRLGRIERLAGQRGHQLLQFGLAAAAGQADAHQMLVDVEVGVFFPPGAASAVVGDARAELAVLQQMAFDGAAQPIEVAGALEQLDADDHHQVAGRVHAQPRGVHRRHAHAARGLLGHRSPPLAPCAAGLVLGIRCGGHADRCGL